MAALLAATSLLLLGGVPGGSLVEGAATVLAAAGAVAFARTALRHEHARAYTTEHYKLRMRLAEGLVQTAVTSLDELVLLRDAAVSQSPDLDARHAKMLERLRAMGSMLMTWQLVRQGDEALFNAINEFGSKARRSADMIHTVAKNGDAKGALQAWNDYRVGHAHRLEALVEQLGRNLDADFRSATGTPSWISS